MTASPARKRVTFFPTAATSPAASVPRIGRRGRKNQAPRSPVGRRDGRRTHPDQDLVVLRRRRRHVADAHHLRRAVPLVDRSAHALSSCAIRGRAAPTSYPLLRLSTDPGIERGERVQLPALSRTRTPISVATGS